MERTPLGQLAVELGSSESELIARFASAPRVDWTARGLKIVRLRLLGERFHPFWDISYCWGELNGHPVQVTLPFTALPRTKGYGLVEELNRANLSGKRLGIWDAISTLQ